MKHALRICNEPGCPQIAGDGGRCAVHQAAKDAIREAYRVNRPETPRPSPQARGYGAEWQRIRKRILLHHPTCVECGARATEVDHVIPLRDGGTNDAANMQPLCHACHSRKTASESGGWSRLSKRKG